MKKLKTIFSPRKLIFWLAIIMLIFTAPQLNSDAMSQTETIVTSLFVDKQENEFNIAVTVLAPGQERNKNLEVYQGSGETLSQAVDSVSLALGKEMGFAQCSIMGLGNSICEEGVIQALDYMTRTKKVGRNAVLINFDADIGEFAQAVKDIDTNKNLSLEKIINFDKRYILSQDSNIESFYIGYFSELSLGIMPRISIVKEATQNAIQVNTGQTGSTSSSSMGGNQSSSQQSSSGGNSYLLNNGTSIVFKEGKQEMVLSPDLVEKVNIFVNDNQKNALVLNNVTDSTYKDATVVVDVVKKDISFSPTFKDGQPLYKADVTLTVSVEEVNQQKLTKSMLKRNQEFLTPTLIEKIKEKTKENMLSLTEFCKEKKLDLIGIYKNYYRSKYKQWKNYLNNIGLENYLDNIKYEINISVISEF